MPREPASPPTMTGRPRSEGSRLRSTETKKRNENMADSGSTTGTVATGGVGTQTLGELRQQIRLLLSSSSDWPNAALDVFIQDAIIK